MGKNYWHHQIGIRENVQLNSIINMVLKSSSSSLLFYKAGVPKNFAEFTWKQLRSVTLIKKTPVQMLSCEFCKIFKSPFLTEHLRTTASGFFPFPQLFFSTQWTNINQAFSIFEHALSRLSNMMHIKNFTSQNRWPSCSYIPRDTRS